MKKNRRTGLSTRERLRIMIRRSFTATITFLGMVFFWYDSILDVDKVWMQWVYILTYPVFLLLLFSPLIALIYLVF